MKRLNGYKNLNIDLIKMKLNDTTKEAVNDCYEMIIKLHEQKLL